MFFILSTVFFKISIKIKKQQELEYILIQTSAERDKTNHLLEEKANKLAFVEAEKNKLDEIVSFLIIIKNALIN